MPDEVYSQLSVRRNNYSDGTYELHCEVVGKSPLFMFSKDVIQKDAIFPFVHWENGILCIDRFRFRVVRYSLNGEYYICKILK